MDGELLRRERGFAGETGHMNVNPHQGRPCGCGARRCLEAEAGERALLEAAGRDGGATGAVAVRSVVVAADYGDVAGRAALRRAGVPPSARPTAGDAHPTVLTLRDPLTLRAGYWKLPVVQTPGTFASVVFFPVDC